MLCFANNIFSIIFYEIINNHFGRVKIVRSLSDCKVFHNCEKDEKISEYCTP